MEFSNAGTPSNVIINPGETVIYTEYMVVHFKQLPPLSWSPHQLEERQKEWRASRPMRRDVYNEPEIKPRRLVSQTGEKSVAELMTQGWRPQGGVGVVGKLGQSEIWLYQAMVR